MPSPDAHARREHLRELLRRFEPADAEEAAHLERMRALLCGPSDPFARDCFEPGHFTASAFILSPDREQLLLIFHGKLARWLQPGGHVDPQDADVRAAARREAAEEVGLSDLVDLDTAAPFDLDVHAIPARATEPAHAHFDLRFALQAKDTGVAAGSDAKAARWVGLDAIDATTSDRSVMRAVEKLRARVRR